MRASRRTKAIGGVIFLPYVTGEASAAGSIRTPPPPGPICALLHAQPTDPIGLRRRCPGRARQLGWPCAPSVCRRIGYSDRWRQHGHALAAIAGGYSGGAACAGTRSRQCHDRRAYLGRHGCRPLALNRGHPVPGPSRQSDRTRPFEGLNRTPSPVRATIVASSTSENAAPLLNRSGAGRWSAGPIGWCQGLVIFEHLLVLGVVTSRLNRTYCLFPHVTGRRSPLH